MGLLFKLEHCRDLGEIVPLMDELFDWFDRHPRLAALKSAFALLAGRLLAEGGSTLPMPEDLLEARTMLATRKEEWKQRWREEGLEEGRQVGRLQGHQEGRQEGEATLLLRQLERRFGPLPQAVRERVAGAEPSALEERDLRVLDTLSVDDVFD